MYSAVPPPDSNSSVINKDGEFEKEGPPRGISHETWEKFQQLKERRIKYCKTSTEKRIKDLKNEATKSVLDHLRSDEEVAVLRDHGVVCQVGKKCKQRSALQGPEKNRAKKEHEKQWSELQQYIRPEHHVLSSVSMDDQAEARHPCPAKNEMKESLDSAIKDGMFEKAEELNKQLMQHDFVVKVAEAVECRDFAKRKAVDDEKAKKRKRSKPHWAFEQKARWESKGNM